MQLNAGPRAMAVRQQVQTVHGLFFVVLFIVSIVFIITDFWC
jgi:hypothetical protein